MRLQLFGWSRKYHQYPRSFNSEAIISFFGQTLSYILALVM